MTDEVRRVDHYSASIPNKVGEGARILGALRDRGVNLIAVWGYPQKGRARLEFILESGVALSAAAKQAKIRLGKKRTAIYACGEDRPGAVAEVLEKLAASRINVDAVQAVCGGAGRYGAVIYLAPAAARKALSALGAA